MLGFRDFTIALVEICEIAAQLPAETDAHDTLPILRKLGALSTTNLAWACWKIDIDAVLPRGSRAASRLLVAP